ncbi:MAG: DUF434 domain-containing protein [bacterium]|nr:DUF434 domain-containing protein [bacterium]
MDKKKHINDSFQNAVADYRYLLERNYPDKESIKLVGNRYGLSGTERAMLFRGVFTEALCTQRKNSLTTDLKGKELHIDGYNVLFTIMNYLLGKRVFPADDGVLRDTGGSYGKIESESLFYKAMDLLLNWLETRNPSSITIYLDRPVESSDTHKKEIENRSRALNVEARVLLCDYADAELKKLKNAIIATSDSEIMDAAHCRIIDIPRQVLASGGSPRAKGRLPLEPQCK